MAQGLKKGATLQGGTYQIEEVLGQGTFGITYLAVHLRLKKKIAIKEFFMGEVNSRKADSMTVEGSTGSVFTDYRKKFRKEAENLANLRHTGIVNVSDIFDENGTTYYVMDFLEGYNLDRYIGAKGNLKEEEAIAATVEIGKALDYMHSKRMLHLDVKPGNIMRDADGRYCLIDFGLSKQFTDNGLAETSTSIGLGTPGYAPVEQSSFKQEGIFPATLDVYALGATMYKMLTGKRPPEATYILNYGFPTEDLTKYGVTGNTVNTLKKAMMPIFRNRYQSVHEFLTDLENGNDVTSRIEDEKTILTSANNSNLDSNRKIAEGLSVPPIPKTTRQEVNNAVGKPEKKNSGVMILLMSILGVCVIILVGWLISKGLNSEASTEAYDYGDSAVEVVTAVSEEVPAVAEEAVLDESSDVEDSGDYYKGIQKIPYWVPDKVLDVFGKPDLSENENGYYGDTFFRHSIVRAGKTTTYSGSFNNYPITGQIRIDSNGKVDGKYAYDSTLRKYGDGKSSWFTMRGQILLDSDFSPYVLIETTNPSTGENFEYMLLELDPTDSSLVGRLFNKRFLETEDNHFYSIRFTPEIVD